MCIYLSALPDLNCRIVNNFKRHNVKYTVINKIFSYNKKRNQTLIQLVVIYI